MPTHLVRWTPAILLALAGSPDALGGCEFPPSMHLPSLDGSAGFILRGIDPYDRCGNSVTGVGDLNNDGYDDLAIAAIWGDPSDLYDDKTGEVYIVFGRPGLGSTGDFDLAALDGSNGLLIRGVGDYDITGNDLDGGVDFNGDGIDDLVIGAAWASPGGKERAGAAYVVFGGAAVGSSGLLELATLDGSDGFVMHGIDAQDRLGGEVAALGDMNGDGFGDLAVSARAGDPVGRPGAGETYIVFGATNVGAGGALDIASLDGSNGFVANGVAIGDYSGNGLGAAGDLNGDGYVDLLIGADNAAPGGLAMAGESYVIFGSAAVGASGSFELSALDGSNGFALSGVSAGDESGQHIAGVGDMNADGFDDIIIGARRADAHGDDTGEAYVVFGGPGVGASGTVALAALDGSNGFVAYGIGVDDFTGAEVAGVGDLNGDNIADLLVSASSRSRTYVLFGDPLLGSSGVIELADLDGSVGFTTLGLDNGDRSGYSAACGGDVNGDGLDDLVIGAEKLTRPGPAGEGEIWFVGEAYVVYGLGCPGDLAGDCATDVFDFAELASNFGAGPGATLSMGDITGDGFIDVFDFAELAADFGCSE